MKTHWTSEELLSKCPVCQQQLRVNSKTKGDFAEYDCSIHGPFVLSRTLSRTILLNPKYTQVLSDYLTIEVQRSDVICTTDLGISMEVDEQQFEILTILLESSKTGHLLPASRKRILAIFDNDAAQLEAALSYLSAYSLISDAITQAFGAAENILNWDELHISYIGIHFLQNR
ncbi:hypothetical protein ACLEX4_15615 [Pseudescherichia vulneris]